MTVPDAPEQDAAHDSGQTAGPCSLPNILIVDDNPIDRFQASRLVGLDPRCRVICAEDGVQALELMVRHDISVVLTDLKMERMDGLALVRAVRRNHPHVPVILMTAHGSEEAAVEALRLGAADYVPKARIAHDLHSILSRSLRTATAGQRRRRCLHSLVRRESRFELGNDPDLLPSFLEFLQNDMSQLDRWDPTEVIRITIAVDEAVRNALYHGNLELSLARKDSNHTFADLARERLDQAPYRDRRIEILIVHERARSEFVIRDDGFGFDTSTANDAIDPDDLLKSDGRGLLLMKSFMDSVKFNLAGNQVTMVKERTNGQSTHRGDAACDVLGAVPSGLSGLPAPRPDGGDFANKASAGSVRASTDGKHSAALLSAALDGHSTLEPRFYKRLLDQLHDAVYFVDNSRRILYWNDAAERLTGYLRAEVVGKHCHDGILEHVDLTGCQLCFQGCPLQQAMSRNQPVQDRVLLRHKDGRRISVDVRVMPVHDGKGRVIGGVEIFRDATADLVVESAFRQVREEADRDPLTGLANRRYLDRMLARHLEQASRSVDLLAVIMADLDHFKQINDNWGHAVGDQALVQFARVLQGQCRQHDLVARVGGEEFIVLLPGHSLETAAPIAERLRKCTVEATPENLGERRLTASFGVAQAVPGEPAADLLKRADRALYRAKANGRDRVELEPC